MDLKQRKKQGRGNMEAILISDDCGEFKNELARRIDRGYRIQGQLVVTPCKTYSSFTNGMVETIKYSIIMIKE